MSLLEELETLLDTRQPYANGNAEKSYPLVAKLIQQLRAAQQSAHLTADVLCPECHDAVTKMFCETCGATFNAAQQSAQYGEVCPECHEPLVNGVCPALYALQDTPRR